MLSSLPEEQLVARCQKELPYKLDAYREIVRRYESIVYNTSVKMIGSVQDAEEICQDTFLRVFHKLHQFEGRAAFKTWLFRIVYNFCLTRRKQLAKRRDREGVNTDDLSESLVASESPVDGMSLSEELEKAMALLDEDQRRMIVLKYITGLSLQEIADVSDLGLSATKMRLYRALEEFKRIYTAIREGKEPEL
ncbi:MAG: sigma-70 family RNA polymerase sigma factor [Verrucomicrobiales bacterium]|nr:sigma-70 family RNA polymerase sigma factor [Verrucomicrobiae bacterium]